MSEMSDIEERLSEYAHKAWSGWINYMFEKSTSNPDGTVTIPIWAVVRWRRQASTAYAHLSEAEKDSDREEAKRMIRIFGNKK